MFGRSVSLVVATLLLLILGSNQALARKKTLANSTPFGLGLTAGVEKYPKSGFVAGTQAPSSLYASNFAAEPFFNMINFEFRAHAGWDFYPQINGAGTDSSGLFTESSNGGNFNYGLRVLLYPFVGKNYDTRIYFQGSLYETNTKLKNSRKYLSGAMFNSTNVEKLSGSGTEMNFGVGFEFWLIQNYSMQLEAGYVNRTTSSFTYQTTTDVSGTTRSTGETAKDANGNPKGLHTESPYLQLGINLNL